MKVVQQLADVQKTPGPVILAAGTFDGIHKGHQAVIQRAVEKASAVKGSAWVLTLDPHPLKILHPARAPKLLTSTSHKLQLIEPLGIQGCLVMPFTPERAAQEPEAFVADLAAAIPRAGVSTVKAWLAGEKMPGSEQLNALARAFGVPAGALLSELASTLDPARTQGEHDLLAAYRALNTRQQGALLEVARGMAGQAARRKR